jgi:hypothetical protein
MSGSSLPPLVRTIEFLRDAARAPMTEWASFARAVDELPRVFTSEAGDVAAALASSARGILRQIPRVEQEADAEMRQLLKSLADVMQHQQNAHGAKPHYIEKS